MQELDTLLLNSHILKEAKAGPRKNLPPSASLLSPKTGPFRTIEDYKRDSIRMQSNRGGASRESGEKVAPSPPGKH